MALPIARLAILFPPLVRTNSRSENPICSNKFKKSY